ncbi:La domain-containing protein [Cryptosporidium felis]|nr:La domain-containing protein [Cryptosporidium felis]
MDTKQSRLDKIRQQVEFYFSDSNIRHDKYLRSKLMEFKFNDFGLPVSLISSFNRMVQLNATVQDIITSISSSKKLFVNFETQTIHRNKPINLDSCSVIPHERMLFIKRIPKNWDHNNLRALIGTFGNVLVVKLPKINKSNVRRHYGFVEMETAKQATEAIENYRKIFPYSKLIILPWSRWISTKYSFRRKSKKNKLEDQIAYPA